VINLNEKMAVIKAAREWAKAESRLRSAGLTYGEEKEWVVRESDRTEEALLQAVEKLTATEQGYPGKRWWLGSSPYEAYVLDPRLEKLTREYAPTLFDLSTKLEEVQLPGKLITIHAPFHTIEFHHHRKVCKECGK
jgi:hypothetical protein